jgi:hypothetical protein
LIVLPPLFDAEVLDPLDPEPDELPDCALVSLLVLVPLVALPPVPVPLPWPAGPPVPVAPPVPDVAPAPPPLPPEPEPPAPPPPCAIAASDSNSVTVIINIKLVILFRMVLLRGFHPMGVGCNLRERGGESEASIRERRGTTGGL